MKSKLDEVRDDVKEMKDDFKEMKDDVKEVKDSNQKILREIQYLGKNEHGSQPGKFNSFLAFID